MDSKWKPKKSKVYKLPPIWKQRRTLIAILSFLGTFITYCLRLNLLGAIKSVKHSESSKMDYNSLSWYFIGYITTQLTSGLLSCKYGGVKLFGFCVLGAAIVTLFAPLYQGQDTNIYFIVNSIMIGISTGVIYPSIFAVWSRWAPVGQRIWLSSLAYSGSFMGLACGYVLYGWLTHEWKYTYTYITGIASIIWSVVWLTCISETPEEDENITTEELNYIVNSVHWNDVENDHSIYSLKSLFTSKPIWAIACAKFASTWGNVTLVSQLPIYLKRNWNPVNETANYFPALPFLIMATCLQISAVFAHLLKKNVKLTTYQIGKICTCVALISQVVFILLIPYATSEYTAIFYLSVAPGIGSLVWLGIIINILLIAPQYASISIAISNTFATIPKILIPILAKSNNNADSGNRFFYIASGVSMFGTIIYVLFSSGKRQPWAKEAIYNKKGVILIKRQGSIMQQ